MARRLTLSLLVLAAGAALLVAAGFVRPAGSATAGDAAEARKGGTLRLSRHTDVDYVDPALANFTHSWMLEFATCAKLFNNPDQDGTAGTQVIPEVVRDYALSRDRRTYTFDLRRAFRFHTGGPVTARNFALAFNRDANPRMKSPAANYMHGIVGADAVLKGRARTISGVRVLGRYRLQIRLTRPLGDFPARLTMPYFCPILPDTAIDPAGIDDPPGSGPYYVAERIPNRRIVLKRNPYYRGARPANVDQIVYTVSESPEVCLLATEQNRIDHCVLFGIPRTAYPRLAKTYGVNRPGGRFFVGPRLDTWYFAFNHDRSAFKGRGQIPLKKAINYAIDRSALARTFGYLGGRRDDQMLPPELGRNESFYPLRGADPATARRWLARAKFKPTKLVLYAYSDNAGTVEAAQVFKFNLKQIGIDVDVRYFDQTALGEKAGTRGEPFDVAMGAWSVDYGDPASYYEPLLNGESIQKTGNLNLSYLDDPRVNARIRAANRLRGRARRRAWAELDAYLMRNDPPWAPYFHTTRASFVSSSFGCFVWHPIYSVDIAAACKK
jgi:ABC-type oligopeptide transport system substrate-binding subunit